MKVIENPVEPSKLTLNQKKKIKRKERKMKKQRQAALWESLENEQIDDVGGLENEMMHQVINAHDFHVGGNGSRSAQHIMQSHNRDFQHPRYVETF